MMLFKIFPLLVALGVMAPCCEGRRIIFLRGRQAELADMLVNNTPTAPEAPLSDMSIFVPTAMNVGVPAPAAASIAMAAAAAMNDHEPESEHGDGHDLPPVSVFLKPNKFFDLVREAQANYNGTLTSQNARLILAPVEDYQPAGEAQDGMPGIVTTLEEMFPMLFANSTGGLSDNIGEQSSLNVSTNSVLDWLLNGTTVESENEGGPQKTVNLDMNVLTSLFNNVRGGKGVEGAVEALREAMNMPPVSGSGRNPPPVPVLHQNHGPRPIGVADDVFVTLLENLQKTAEANGGSIDVPALASIMFAPDESSVSAADTQMPIAVLTDDSMPLSEQLHMLELSTVSEQPIISEQPTSSDQQLVDMLSTMLAQTAQTTPPQITETTMSLTKPEGGISDDAIAAIMMDVRDILNSTEASSPTTTYVTPEMGEESVSKLMDSLMNLHNSTASDSNTTVPAFTDSMLTSTLEELFSNVTSPEPVIAKEEETKKPKTTTTGKSSKKKPVRKLRGNKNGTSTNRIRKRPDTTKKVKPAKTTTIKPSLLERIFKTAADSFFGTTPQPNLFEMEDFIDIIGQSI